MARVELLDPDALAADDRAVLEASSGGARNRLLTLGHMPGLAEALQVLSRVIEASRLEPEVRATAAIAVVRRSPYESRRVVADAERAGLTEDMIQAIDDEDWTEPSFSPRQKTALQYALKYDAGHGIQDAYFDEVKRTFSAREIIELGAICGYFGLLARSAIALGYPVES